MIYPIEIDSHIDKRIEEFYAKLPESQKVVHIQTTEKYLFIMTEKKGQKDNVPKNLLLEEIHRRAKAK